MSEHDLDPELRALEARLAARARPMPTPALRQRIESGLERARARERFTWLAACAAVLLVTITVRSTLPAFEDASRTTTGSVEERDLAVIGIPASEAARWVTVLNAARIPAVAPWTDTRSGASAHEWSSLNQKVDGG